MIEFRLAIPQDFAELHKLNSILNDKSDCATVEQMVATFASNPQEIVCVAVNGTIIIGFCCGQLLKSICYPMPFGEITELFVLPKWRRQNIGRRLLGFMEVQLRTCGVMEIGLATGIRNENAQKFYEACGYEKRRFFLIKNTPI